VLRKLLGINRKERLAENEVRVVLPEEVFALMEYRENDLPCIAVVNSGLVSFRHKDIFPWHLSVIIDFEQIVDNGMPSEEEREIVEPFCDQLDEDIKAGGNALFLVRETWNKTRRLVWIVHIAILSNRDQIFFGKLANALYLPTMREWVQRTI
jgi:hypothetical protein